VRDEAPIITASPIDIHALLGLYSAIVLPHIPPPIYRFSLTRDEPAKPTDAGPPPVARRNTRGGSGRLYPDDTVWRVRHLLENTTLTQREIVRRTGVPQATISLWLRQRGWMRPLDAPLNPVIASLWRIGPAMKLTLLTGRLVAVAERMVRELEENPDTDIDKLMQAVQAVRMARVTLQGNRRRKLLIGRARTGFEVMKEDDAIRAALKEMRGGGVDLDRAPKEAMDLLIKANTPAEKDEPALRPRGRRR
jgi:transcriptional regulator with XRE-family HTH domain